MILVLGGTKDSLEIAQSLWLEYPEIVLSVATDYGEKQAHKSFKGKVICGIKDRAALQKYCQEEGITLIVDATHPYAAEVSQNAIEAAKTLEIPYVRYERPMENIAESNVTYCEDYVQAAQIADKLEGNIFLATGSKHIEMFLQHIQHRERVRVRVLPQSHVFEKLQALGLNAEQIIAMKGPFTEALNREMFKQTHAKILVSKQSGSCGGEAEKIRAACQEDMQLILLRRPDIDYPVACQDKQELKQYVCKQLGIEWEVKKKMPNNLGLMHVYYGHGKGKTTAALGLGVRAAGYDKKVCIIQFLKSGDTGELFSAKRLAPYLNIVQFDKPKGFYFNMNEQEREELKKKTQQGFDYAQDQLKSGEWDLVILDEVLGSLTNGLISVEQVTAALQNKHPDTEVVLTGRELPNEVEKMADYVTEMREHKHPMHRGVKARKGIEY